MSEVEIEIIERLTRIEQKVDGLANHEARISSLERWRSWATGIAAGVAGVFGGAKWLLMK